MILIFIDCTHHHLLIGEYDFLKNNLTDDQLASVK